MLTRDPVQPPGGTAQLRQRRIRSGPQVLQFAKIARKPLTLLHRRALEREILFLARNRCQGIEFGDVRLDQVLLRRRRVDPRAGLCQRLFGPAPLVPRLGDPGAVGTGIAIEQQAVAAGIDQPAIVMLAVQFDEKPRQLAQQRHADRLVVDMGTAAAIGAHAAAHQQGLARLPVDLRLCQQRHDPGGTVGEFEGRGDAGLLLATADEPAVGPVAQHEAQRIQQDRLACPGFTGEHAQPAGKRQVQRFDQDDIANGKSGEHRFLSSASKRRRHPATFLSCFTSVTWCRATDM